MKNPTDIWNAKTSDYNNLSRTKSETRSFLWTKIGGKGTLENVNFKRKFQPRQNTRGK